MVKFKKNKIENINLKNIKICLKKRNLKVSLFLSNNQLPLSIFLKNEIITKNINSNLIFLKKYPFFLFHLF